ncbi:MAG: hypothetical protein J3K34DRAFT_428041, partial [Monoraphidium minutum]
MRQDKYKHRLQPVSVPTALVAAWFPGTPLPLDVSLQLEVDGAPWGPRFDSTVNAGSQISKGVRSLVELAGCRLTAFRRAAGPAALDLVVSSLTEAPAAGAGRRIGPGRAAEAGDMAADTWPVANTFSAAVRRYCRLALPAAMVAACWPGASFPLPLSVATVVGSTPRGAALQGELRQRDGNSRLRYCLHTPGHPLPLAVGAAITRFRRAAPGAIEVHATEPAAATAAATSAAPAASRDRRGSQRQQQEPAARDAPAALPRAC